MLDMQIGRGPCLHGVRLALASFQTPSLIALTVAAWGLDAQFRINSMCLSKCGGY